jgi:tRNA splicing ligase
MAETKGNQSEVARILEEISLEYEAAQRGLYGFAYGAAKHEFITARMENMGNLHSKLQDIVGDSAIALVAETLNQLP